jgi:hypothetical protein
MILAVLAGGAWWYFYYDSEEVNDEKRHINRKIDIRVYKSLIIAAVILLGMVLMAIADSYGVDVLGFAIMLVYPASLALVVIFVISVVGLFRCSWVGRRRLLLWYACVFTVILILESTDSTISVKTSEYIGYLGGIILLLLPVVWLWNAFRS